MADHVAVEALVALLVTDDPRQQPATLLLVLGQAVLHLPVGHPGGGLLERRVRERHPRVVEGEREPGLQVAGDGVVHLLHPRLPLGSRAEQPGDLRPLLHGRAVGLLLGHPHVLPPLEHRMDLQALGQHPVVLGVALLDRQVPEEDRLGLRRCIDRRRCGPLGHRLAGEDVVVRPVLALGDVARHLLLAVLREGLEERVVLLGMGTDLRQGHPTILADVDRPSTAPTPGNRSQAPR